MGDKLDLSLDDIIKINKKTNPKGKRGGRGGGNRKSTGGGVGQTRGNKRGGGRGRGRGRSRSAPYSRSTNVPNDKWDHDMYNSKQGGNQKNFAGDSRTGGSGKLLVTNLDYGVSDSDITELFSEFGALRKSSVHYDRSGRSLGTADVHFERRSDAAKALQQYDGVPLDGRIMQIKFADGSSNGSNLSQEMNGRIGQKKTGQFGGGRGRGRGQGRGRGRGRGGGGRGRGRQQKTEVSAEELDKQLDDYISKMEE